MEYSINMSGIDGSDMVDEEFERQIEEYERWAAEQEKLGPQKDTIIVKKVEKELKPNNKTDLMF